MDVIVFLFPLFFFQNCQHLSFLVYNVHIISKHQHSSFHMSIKGFWPVSLYTKKRGVDHKLLTWVDATFKYVLCNALIVVFRSVMDI